MSNFDPLQPEDAKALFRFHLYCERLAENMYPPRAIVIKTAGKVAYKVSRRIEQRSTS